MTVLLVQVHPKVHPEGIEDVLRVGGTPHQIAHAYSEPQLPDPADFRAVMVFGTPASCTELDQHPDLLRVRDFMACCLSVETPLLGICFGGQLLAQLLGAEVRRAEIGEFGAYTVRLTEQGLRSPYFAGFPASFSMPQFHYDRFDLPPGAASLAYTAHGPCQAFAIRRALGLQFHIEAVPETLSRWAAVYPEGLAHVGKTVAQIRDELAAQAAAQRRLCKLFVDNFLRTAASASSPGS